MPAKRYKVTLEPDERGDLEKLISRGKGAARRLAHARILLHADQGEGRPGKTDAEIAEAVGVSVATIERVRQHFVEEGLEVALSPRPPRRLYPRKLDGEAEARLIHGRGAGGVSPAGRSPASRGVPGRSHQHLRTATPPPRRAPLCSVRRTDGCAEDNGPAAPSRGIHAAVGER
jgi:hypothetical protein